LDADAFFAAVAAEIALTIRKAINQQLKITVSEGIGSNKLVSIEKGRNAIAASRFSPGRRSPVSVRGQQLNRN